MIAAQIPIGLRSVCTVRFGIGLGSVLPYNRLPSPSMKIARSADDATSATAFFHGLPVSAWTISPKAFSRSRSSCAARPSIAPRFGTGVRPHSSDTAAADDSACATSAAPPRATCAIT